MLTQKERFRVTFLFIGIFLTFVGMYAFFQPGAPVSDGHSKGDFVMALSSGAIAGYAPRLLVVGGLSLFSSYLLRKQ